MLNRLATRSLINGVNYTRKFLFSATAAEPLLATDRHQPFVKIQQIQPAIQHNNPPIIEPKLIDKDQFVMQPNKFVIDCNKYDSNTINPNNTTLCNEMKQKFADTGLVYLTNTKLTEFQSMHDLITILIPSEMNMEYKGGSNWRNYIEPNIYDTGAPKEAWVHYHHEMAYIRTSPQTLAFCAKRSLPNGRGATYVSDQVQATKDLLKTEFGQKLKEKRICYVRCLTDEEHYKNSQQSEFDVYNHWQKSFGTQDPDEAAEIAQERGLKIEWDMNHERYGRYLKTKFYTDVYEYCPMLDKNILFASVADHWMWFDTWPGVNLLANDDRPLKITYGDDSELSQDELKQFVDIYDKYGLPVEWNVGDIVILCNYRWAHGRPVYDLENENEERNLGVVLGQVFDRVG
eukprot:971272_1